MKMKDSIAFLCEVRYWCRTS